MAAALQAGREQPARLVPAHRPAPFARHVAVAGMDLDGGAVGADAELDDPLRGPGAAPPAVLLLGLAPLQRRDLGVDALDPQGVPDAQRAQSVQVGRQVVEHIFDSKLKIHPARPRVFDYLFDTVKG